MRASKYVAIFICFVCLTTAKKISAQNVILKNGIFYTLKDSVYNIVVSELKTFEYYEDAKIFNFFVSKKSVITDSANFIFGILTIQFGNSTRDGSVAQIPIVDCLKTGEFCFNLSNLRKQKDQKRVAVCTSCVSFLNSKLLKKFSKGSTIEKEAINIDRVRSN